MNAQSAIMSAMFAPTVPGEADVPKKDQSKPAPGRPPADPPKGKRMSLRLRADLDESLTAYLDSLRPRPTDTAAIEAALEDFLRAKGFWSPPAKGK